MHRKYIPICIQQDATIHFIYIWKLLYMFRVLLPPIIRSAYNCIYSIWYLSHHYCYAPLLWRSLNFHLHPKHVERFPDKSKLCKVASCWIYIGIYSETSFGEKINKLCVLSGNMSEKGMPENIYIYIHARARAHTHPHTHAHTHARI